MTPNQDPYNDYNPFSKWNPTQVPEPSQDQSIQKEDAFGKWKMDPEEVERSKKFKNPFSTSVASDQEYRNMSIWEKIAYAQDLEKDIQFEEGKTFSKGLAEGSTLGIINAPREEGESEFVRTAGKVLGQTPAALGAYWLTTLAAAPFAAFFAGSKPLQVGFQAGQAFTAGSALGATKEGVKAAKGEEVNLLNIPLEGAEWAAIDLGAQAAFKYIPKGYQWFKGLTKKGQEDVVVRGVIPEDMTSQQINFYNKEIAPKIRDKAEAEWKVAHQEAVVENDAKYAQELANVKGKHQEAEYRRSEIQQEYEAKSKEIESQNQSMMEQWEKDTKAWEESVKREDAVQSATKLVSTGKGSGRSLQGRVSEGGEAFGIQSPTLPPPTRIENQAGSIISPRRISNPTVAGENNVAAVRASAKSDRSNVQKLYKESDSLNEGIVASREDLANEIRAELEVFDSLGANLTPEQASLRSDLRNTLNELLLFDEEGAAVGFREVSNQYLLKQAQVLRDKMDYSFAQGDAANINRPWVDAYQDSVEAVATQMGRQDAVLANQAARTKHREWQELYNNPYIRQYRNTKTNKPTTTFKNSLNIDNYRNLDNVLSRSQTGERLSQETRRALVDKELAPFYKNPRTFSIQQLDDTLNNLRPVLRPGEEEAIRNTLVGQRRTVRATEKGPSGQRPEEPKFKESPEKPKEGPSFVNIPKKPKVKPTPSMKEAARRMKTTGEEIEKLTHSHDGFKKIKDMLGEGKAADQLYKDMVKYRTRDILFGGRVHPKFKGTELVDRLNVRKDYELLSELHGEEAIKDLYQAAEKIGNHNVTRESITKYIKHGATIKLLLNTVIP